MGRQLCHLSPMMVQIGHRTLDFANRYVVSSSAKVAKTARELAHIIAEKETYNPIHGFCCKLAKAASAASRDRFTSTIGWG